MGGILAKNFPVTQSARLEMRRDAKKNGLGESTRSGVSFVDGEIRLV